MKTFKRKETETNTPFFTPGLLIPTPPTMVVNHYLSAFILTLTAPGQQPPEINRREKAGEVLWKAQGIAMEASGICP